LGSYRNKLDILADILRIASRGAKKTQIMYQANLSYKLLIKYLAECRKAYFIRLEQSKRRYVLTDKGKKFLEEYKGYAKSNRHVEKRLKDIRAKRRVLEDLCSSG